MSAYWYGLVTTPAVVVASWACVSLWFRIINGLANLGILVAARWKRDLASVSDYTLKHDIWWERAYGPVFGGGWYREKSDGARFTRWVGVGRADGPNVMCFDQRRVGDVE